MKRVSKRIFEEFFCNRNPVALGYAIDSGKQWKCGAEHRILSGYRRNAVVIAKIKKTYKNGKRRLFYFIDQYELGAWQLSLAMQEKNK